MRFGKNLSPIPVARRGVNSSFKWFLPVFATRRGRGEGIRALWCWAENRTRDLYLSACIGADNLDTPHPWTEGWVIEFLSALWSSCLHSSAIFPGLESLQVVHIQLQESATWPASCHAPWPASCHASWTTPWTAPWTATWTAPWPPSWHS